MKRRMAIRMRTKTTKMKKNSMIPRRTMKIMKSLKTNLMPQNLLRNFIRGIRTRKNRLDLSLSQWSITKLLSSILVKS